MNNARFLILTSAFTMIVASANAGEDINCHLKMTNDHVNGTFMMSESSATPEDCKSKCREYGDKNIKQMADPDQYDPVMKVLSYECVYEDKAVDNVDYKK